MTFFDFMMRYIQKDSPAGDLARDMLEDEAHFPDTNNSDDIMQYLISRRACSECLRTFKTCYKRYELHEHKQKQDYIHDEADNNIN